MQLSSQVSSLNDIELLMFELHQLWQVEPSFASVIFR